MGGLGILDAMKQSRNQLTPTKSETVNSNPENKIKEKVGQAIFGFFGKQGSKDTKHSPISARGTHSSPNGDLDLKQKPHEPSKIAALKSVTGRSQTSSQGSSKSPAPLSRQKKARTIEDPLADTIEHDI